MRELLEPKVSVYLPLLKLSWWHSLKWTQSSVLKTGDRKPLRVPGWKTVSFCLSELGLWLKVQSMHLCDMKKLLILSPTWVRGFLLNDEGFKIWTEDCDITQVKSAALNLKSFELWADLLEAVDDVLDHDVLQGEEGELRPVAEHTRIQGPRVVAPQEHRLKVGTAVGWNKWISHEFTSEMTQKETCNVAYLWWTVSGRMAPCRISRWTWSPPSPRNRTPAWGRRQQTRGTRGWTRGDRSPAPRWHRHPWPEGKFNNVCTVYTLYWSSSSLQSNHSAKDKQRALN